jgi:hypothetical protein
MARKKLHANFSQTLDNLRAHSFTVEPFAAIDGAVLVTRNGVGAVLAPPQSKEAFADVAISPGVLIKGQIARLLDRGYQKFIKTSQFELPATASQLQAIHAFTEELNQVTGVMGLYNESLGTTSDLYQYDRLRGRETPMAPPARPWELEGGH